MRRRRAGANGRARSTDERETAPAKGAKGAVASTGGSAPNGGEGGVAEEVRRALDRLEKAVEGLAATAGDAIAGRAASFIDEVADRLERDLGRNASRKRRRRRRAERHWTFDRPSAKRLSRDRQRAKLAGVCAGIAHYYGMEPWGGALHGRDWLDIPAEHCLPGLLDFVFRDEPLRRGRAPQSASGAANQRRCRPGLGGTGAGRKILPAAQPAQCAGGPHAG